MLDQYLESTSQKLMIIQLPNDFKDLPTPLKNLGLPNVIVHSHDINFDTTIMSQTKRQPIVEDISRSSKKRKTDLTCIICDGQASGYNFNRITCHSCKEFFRRNALQPIEKLKCLQKKNQIEQTECVIRFDMKTKCSRCRLKKCFDLGMRKDFLLTSEEKLIKQKRIEENRRLRSNPLIDDVSKTFHLSDEDKNDLKEIEQNYRTVWQTNPSPASIFSFEKCPDPQSAFIHSMNIDNFFAIRLIHFLRSIKEFLSLDERDRLTLVKYNLGLTICIESLIAFNIDDELCHFETPLSYGLAYDNSFIQNAIQLYSTCYGAEVMHKYISLGLCLSEAMGKDGRLVLVLILMTIFLKGWSVYDDQASVLIDAKQVFLAQSKYTELFFRSLMDKFSYECAARKMMMCVKQLMKIQQLTLEYDPFVRSLSERIYINPVMKTLLHL